MKIFPPLLICHFKLCRLLHRFLFHRNSFISSSVIVFLDLRYCENRNLARYDEPRPPNKIRKDFNDILLNVNGSNSMTD